MSTTTTKKKHAEQEEALARLREWLQPGDTVYCILRHVTGSGMQRTISFKRISIDSRTGKPYIQDLSWNMAKALGWRYDNAREGVKVDDAGMDMGFHTVHTLARVLFGTGLHHEAGKDPGYLLESRWL
jgi:hypothetical protein